MKKLNNKGFSLVELIIVIAIMAVLAAALAPQLIKYIEKSRESTDTQTCDSIKSSFNAAIANESAYKEVTAVTSGTLTISFSGSTATYTWSGTGFSNLETELKESCADLKAPKASGKKKYQLTWTVTSSGSTSTYNVTNVKVVTIA